MAEENAKEGRMTVKRRPIWILPFYKTVELALWSCLISVAVMFVLFVLPRLPEMRRQQASARLLQIEAEQQFYCQRLGKPAGSDDFNRCMIELQAYRKSIEKRLAEEADF